MAELTRYKEDQPVAQFPGVNDSAKGTDALAHVFGEVGSMVKQQGVEMLEEQSQAGLLQAKNALNDETTRAKIDLINNPDLAQSIKQTSDENIEFILRHSMVNDSHRKDLEYAANNVKNQVGVEAAVTGHHQLLLDTQFKVNTEFPKTLKTIAKLYYHGMDEDAEQMTDELHQAAGNALKIGAMSPQGYSNLSALIQTTVDNAHKIRKMVGSGTGTAADIHAATGSIIGGHVVDEASLPSNEHSAFEAGYYDEEASKEKALSQIYNYGHLTHPEVAQNLKSESLDNIANQWEGVNDAKAHIASGTSQDVLQERFKDLSNRPLSLRERGEFEYLKNYYNRLERGEFLSEIVKTTEGQKIYQNAVKQSRVIENSPDLSKEQKAMYLAQNKEWELQRYVNLWNGLNGDPKYINLLTKEERAPIQNGFTLGQNPNMSIMKIRAYPQSMIPYVADAMTNPIQRSVVSIIGQAGDNLSEGLATSLYLGNQEGFKPTILQPEKEVATRLRLKAQINANADISNAISYLGLMPYDAKAAKNGGMDASSATLEALSNTVLFDMNKVQDYNLTTSNAVINKMGLNMNKAFDIYKNSNAVFNRATLPLADQDLDSLAQYAKVKAYENLQKDLGQKNIIKFLDITDRAPLMIVNLPNNYIAAINSTTRQLALDKRGKPLFFEPYTSSMLHAAHHEKSVEYRKQREKIEKKLEIHPFGSTFQ